MRRLPAPVAVLVTLVTATAGVTACNEPAGPLVEDLEPTIAKYVIVGIDGRPQIPDSLRDCVPNCAVGTWHVLYADTLTLDEPSKRFRWNVNQRLGNSDDFEPLLTLTGELKLIAEVGVALIAENHPTIRYPNTMGLVRPISRDSVEVEAFPPFPFFYPRPRFAFRRVE